jgi:phage shock protein PspC (stress-responsive transcriptional regulator)
MNCNDAVAALVASLEEGGPMTDEQRAHLRTCERCRELLDNAKQFQTLLAGNGIDAPQIDPALAAAEKEVRRQRTVRMLAITAGIMSILAAAAAWLLVWRKDVPPAEAIVAVGFGLGVAMLFTLPVLLIIYYVRKEPLPGKRRLYKRLGTGRVISGVCRGIAETARIDVTLVRIIFLLLLLFNGSGFWLYLILTLAMPIHPDDRQHLIRFKLRRWWQRRTAH